MEFCIEESRKAIKARCEDTHSQNPSIYVLRFKEVFRFLCCRRGRRKPGEGRRCRQCTVRDRNVCPVSLIRRKEENLLSIFHMMLNNSYPLAIPKNDMSNWLSLFTWNLFFQLPLLCLPLFYVFFSLPYQIMLSLACPHFHLLWKNHSWFFFVSICDTCHFIPTFSSIALCSGGKLRIKEKKNAKKWNAVRIRTPEGIFIFIYSVLLRPFSPSLVNNKYMLHTTVYHKKYCHI